MNSSHNPLDELFDFPRRVVTDFPEQVQPRLSELLESSPDGELEIIEMTVILRRYEEADKPWGIHEVLLYLNPSTENVSGMYLVAPRLVNEAEKDEIRASKGSGWEKFKKVPKDVRHFITHNYAPMEWHAALDGKNKTFMGRIWVHHIDLLVVKEAA